MSEAAGHLGVGDRLREGPAAELIDSAFALEAGDGPLLYRGMSLADLAQAIMLLETGLLPAGAGRELLAALLELNALPAEAVPFAPERGDAYSNREYLLRQKVPQAAGWLQAGRPRREVSTLGFLIVVRERLLDLLGAHCDLLRALLTLAEAHLETLMPDYTYLQAAHPTTLAHYLLTFAQPISRDLARLRAVFERVNRSPAGAGSTNGSRLPLDRERLAELLGFAGVAEHTRDAMWQPDVPIEVMSALVAMLVNADRLAEDLQIWATAEFDFIALADRHARISVIMPQKKNPYSLAFVRGVAREMIGRLVSTAAVGATPSGQVDNRIFIYGGVPRALEQSRQAVQLLAGVLAGLEVKRAVMAERVRQAQTWATDLTDVMMLESGLDSRTAHRIVGRAVRATLERGEPLSARLLDEAAQPVIGRPVGLTDHRLAAVTQPEAIVASRTGRGGASRTSCQQLIDSGRATLAEADQWRADYQRHIARAEKTLVEEAERRCQPT